MAAPKPLIAGNWKMYGRQANLAELALLWEKTAGAAKAVDILVCPPAAYVAAAAIQARGTGLLIGAQDCSASGEDAARTGEISAAMLADCGARYLIVGHSERRAQHGETDDLVRRKAEAALGQGLIPIVCVGETLAQRQAGETAAIVAGQVRASVPDSGEIVVAYEPVWAIGGTSTPSLAEIAEVHALVRATLAGRGRISPPRILYGGSVGPANAGEILAVQAVDGALVGRASLKADDFAAIVRAHPSVT
jgi:triosephosphate isomerase (TIM)